MIAKLLETIGNTPLIEIKNFLKDGESGILLKYERNNPGGSIKDRPALHIIEYAEQHGLLKPGGTIVESTSGNFGISLAMIGAIKGYRVIILADPKITEANSALIRSFGAEIIIVTEQDDSGSYHKTRISLANKMAKEIPNSFRPDQCFSLLNSDAHYKKTAREIERDCGCNISTFIAPVSTGGQLGGISRYLKTCIPNVKIIGVDAAGSSVFGGIEHFYKTPGVGLSWTPDNLRLNDIDCVYKITDEQAFVTARAFAKNEGILMGPSSGACALVALSIAQSDMANGYIVSMISDGAERYISTLFNDKWMKDQGFDVDYDINTIRSMSKQLKPWSINPPECANYKPELIGILDVPATTLEINSQFQ
jgi:cystathionine beta-synthase/cysteine synthase A